MRLQFAKTLFLFAMLLFCQFAYAETDLLNLDAYQEGDTPSYGEDIVVGQSESSGIKWITRSSNALDSGTIKFPVNLSGDFEVFLQIYSPRNPYTLSELYFLTSEEYKVKLSISSSNLDLSANNDRTYLGESNAEKTVNKIRLSFSNNIVKVYLNDVFDGKLSLKPDQSYTQLMLQDIYGAKLYAMSISGGTASTATPPASNTTPTQPTTTSACTAKYDAFTGRIIVPCIEVPDAFGGIQTYYIELQQQQGTISFDLDLNTIKQVQ
jgi:hypothetical protein